MTKKTDSYGFVCKWIVKILIALACILIFTWNSNTLKVNAEETTYAHSDTATDASGNVVLKVEWNEPVLGQPLTFHVSATGGSGRYKFNMEAPSYSNPNENAYESVADPSRGEWTKYTDECSSQDYTFTMTASGTYNFRFHVMDLISGVTYLRTNTDIQVSDKNYPSVRSIVETAVNQCKSETDGSDYAKALWLHDWLLQQLDYDNSLKWSSAESALTRRTGTCQAYESAYSQLLSAAGIENAETRDTYDGHTWNAVKMDGQWYQVDCTWDDSNNKYYSFDNRHLYFGLTDELMAIAHPGHEKIYTADGYGTRSASLADNYFVKNGEAAKWVENYRDRIQAQLDAKTTNFTISADNSSYPPSISGIQNGILAYAINQMDWFSNGSKAQLYAIGKATQLEFKVSYNENKPAGGHTQHVWDSGVVVKAPTFDSEGIIRYTCTQCSATKEETINKLTELISYRTHVQDIGWQEYVSDGEMSGTSGQSKRLEGINVHLSSDLEGSVEYQTHVQDIGWQGWVSNGQMAGTTGQSKRLEAIRIKLNGKVADQYDIYYRVHCQDFGWLDWAKNGEPSGSEGYSKRLEAIEIRLVSKGQAAPGSTDRPFVTEAMVSYRTHVQDIGWQEYVSDGEMSGTSGQSKRLEAINIKLSSSINGGIQYRTHIQDIGWQDWKENDQMSGTAGQSKRLEAIQINLTGHAAEKYDIYYRVHCQDFGWLGWAKNGEASGSEGYAKRLEAIEIRLVLKGHAAPGNTDNCFYKR